MDFTLNISILGLVVLLTLCNSHFWQMSVLYENWGTFTFYADVRIWTEDSELNWTLWEDLDSVPIIKTVLIIVFIM